MNNILERRIENTIKCLNELYHMTVNKFQIQSIIDVLDGDLNYEEFCKLNEIEVIKENFSHRGDPCIGNIK